jgi:GntR family transcriptional regulator
MLKEQHLRKVEDALTEAIRAAQIAGLADSELREMLNTLIIMKEN